MPALPVLKEEFGVSESVLNISVNTGLLMTAIGTLISGTLSDRYGRKPILLWGLFISAGGSFLCALSNGVILLSIMRGVSGLGVGFVLTVTTAMIKDSYTGDSFQKIMTVLQSMAAVGPVIAPTLGSLLINIASWRFIFIFLGGSAVISAVPMIISTETWPPEKRISTDLKKVVKDAALLARDPGFSMFLGIVALLTIPVWAYIAVSSYVYIDDFGLNNIEYGVFYGVGSAMSLLGPFLYLVLIKVLKTKKTVSATIAILIVGALILLTGAKFSPFIFLIGIVPLMLAEGIIRPLSTVILLEQHEEQAGSASSLMQFVVNLVGIIGTALGTLSWNSMIFGVGIIALGCAAVSALLWILLLRGGHLGKGLD